MPRPVASGGARGAMAPLAPALAPLAPVLAPLAPVLAPLALALAPPGPTVGPPDLIPGPPRIGLGYPMKSDEIRRILPPPLEFRNLIDYPPSRILPPTHESKSRKTSNPTPPLEFANSNDYPPPLEFYQPPTKVRAENPESYPYPPSNLKIASTTPPPPRIKVKKGLKNRGPTVAPPTKNSWLRACVCQYYLARYFGEFHLNRT